MSGQDQDAELPAGARWLDVNDYLAAIGELYVQNRFLRLTIAAQQRQQASAAAAEQSNHAVQLER